MCIKIHLRLQSYKATFNNTNMNLSEHLFIIKQSPFINKHKPG